MNIALTLILSQIIWFIANRADHFASNMFASITSTVLVAAFSVFVLFLSTLQTVRANKRLVFTCLTLVIAAFTAYGFQNDSSMRSMSIGWIVLSLVLVSIFTLSAVSAVRSFRNFALAAFAILSAVVTFIGLLSGVGVVFVLPGIAISTLLINGLDSKDIVKFDTRDKKLVPSSELIGFPLLLQPTSIGPKDWYETKNLRR